MGTDPFSDLLMQDETLVTEMGRNQLKTGNEFHFRSAQGHLEPLLLRIIVCGPCRKSLGAEQAREVFMALWLITMINALVAV